MILPLPNAAESEINALDLATWGEHLLRKDSVQLGCKVCQVLFVLRQGIEFCAPELVKRDNRATDSLIA